MNHMEPMVENSFEELNLGVKAKVLWEHGEIVSERKHDVNIVTLYRLFNFHVEVYCDADFSEIEDIKVIDPDTLYRLYNYSS
jgi:hypothetical protein